jgi:hypothetical protein
MKIAQECKRYDTEKAVKSAKWDNGLENGIYNQEIEKLFVTPKGNYFQVYYKPWQPNCEWVKFTPLSESDAYDWYEVREQIDLIKDRFSEYVEDA